MLWTLWANRNNKVFAKLNHLTSFSFNHTSLSLRLLLLLPSPEHPAPNLLASPNFSLLDKLLIQENSSFLPSSKLYTIGVVRFSLTGVLHSFFILFARALNANMAKLLTIITGFMVADLLFWTTFTIISYSQVAVDSLSGCSSITDIYSFLGTFCKDLPSWNLKKEIRHVPRMKVHTTNYLLRQRERRSPSSLYSFGSLHPRFSQMKLPYLISVSYFFVRMYP